MHMSLMPSHLMHSYKYDSKTTAYYNAKIRGNVLGKKSIIAIRNVRSTPFSYWGNGISLHHASLLREWENTVSMSSKVASEEIRKLFPDPFPCGPRYLL